jgi:hypothetical protein
VQFRRFAGDLHCLAKPVEGSEQDAVKAQCPGQTGAMGGVVAAAQLPVQLGRLGARTQGLLVVFLAELLLRGSQHAAGQPRLIGPGIGICRCADRRDRIGARLPGRQPKIPQQAADVGGRPAEKIAVLGMEGPS